MAICTILHQIAIAEQEYELAKETWGVANPNKLRNVDASCLDVQFCREKATEAEAKHKAMDARTDGVPL
jgi:hypothetical protein